jgi:hypothetical protein
MEKKERIIFRFCAAICGVSLVLVFAAIAFQTYVRWFVNQNFTVMGGSELEVLTASAFASLLLLAYVHRPHRS